jgi:hypothetical protein
MMVHVSLLATPRRGSSSKLGHGGREGTTVHMVLQHRSLSRFMLLLEDNNASFRYIKLMYVLIACWIVEQVFFVVHRGLMFVCAVIGLR